VHETARWEWLARAVGPGRHVVSVAFDDQPDGEARELLERARVEASDLLGVRIDADAVRAAHSMRFDLAPPASALGREASTAAVRARVSALSGLAAVGAWVAGSGLAAVVEDARAEADRVRSAALFGSTGPK
jgi:oxygen-dependent protoporphyrinogen oxidase